MPSPTPTNRTGTFKPSSIAKTMPPFAVESSFVSTIPGQADSLVERLRLGEPVLAGGRVEDEQRLRLGAGKPLVDDAADLRQLVHQVRLGVEPPGGVGDDHVRVPSDRRVERVVNDCARVRARRMSDDRDARAVGPDPELVDGGGTKGVCGSEDDRAPLLEVAGGHLADGRGLARAVDTDDENDRGPAIGRRPGRPIGVSIDQERRELLADRALRALSVAPAAGALDEIDRQRRPDVARDQCLLDVVPGRTVDATKVAAELGHERSAGLLEPLIEGVRRGDGQERGGIERGVGRGGGLRLKDLGGDGSFDLDGIVGSRSWLLGFGGLLGFG